MYSGKVALPQLIILAQLLEMEMAISETCAPTSWQKMAADWFQLDAYAL